MKRQLGLLLGSLLAMGGALAFCADVPVNPYTFSTTAAAGTLGPFACTGASTATWTWTSGGGATITIKGSADAVVGGTYNTNTNFGTSGVVTAPSANTTSSGNTANYPQGIEATFTGNTGTLSGFVTCTGGLASVTTSGGGGATNTTIVAPTDAGGNVKTHDSVPVQPSPLYTQPVTTPAPASTDSTDSGINVHVKTGLSTPGPAPTASTGATPQANAPYVNALDECFNGNTGSVPSGSVMPLNCGPFGTLNIACQTGCITTPAPLPTATAGVAGPASVGPVTAYDTCTSNGGTAAVTSPNFLVLQCDPQGKLYVSLDDPTQTFVQSSAISTATTTQLVAGIAGKLTYVYLAAWESTGTNASNTVQWEYGTGATCGVSTHTIFPAAVAPGTATGEWTTGWGSQAVSVTTVGGIPAVANRAIVLPAANNFCGVTAGTTTAGTFVTSYNQH